jgi:serine protease Do
MAELQTPPPRIYVWWLAIVTALATVLALVIPGYAPSTRIALAAPGDPTPVAQAAEQGMVQIRTVVDYQNVIGFGSGIILSPDGIVLTCNHVVSGADTITGTVVGTGQSFRGQLLGYDRTEDIAVIQLVGAGGVPPAPIGDSNQVSVGDPVVSFGNANSNGGVSQEVGRVTSLGANIDADDDLTGSSEQLTGLIAMAAPLRPGDSGGPVVNGAGQVIGLNVAASVNYRLGAPTGKGFAIPINRALAIAGQIQSRSGSDTVHIGPPAMLGIGVGTNQQAGSGGVVVRDVLRGTPAEQAGLHRGDVIISLDGVELTNATVLTSVLDRHYPGDVVNVVWQDQTAQQRAAKLTLAGGPGG